MFLLIDIGNSYGKVAVVSSNGQILSQGKFSTDCLLNMLREKKWKIKNKKQKNHTNSNNLSKTYSSYSIDSSFLDFMNNIIDQIVQKTLKNQTFSINYHLDSTNFHSTNCLQNNNFHSLHNKNNHFLKSQTNNDLFCIEKTLISSVSSQCNDFIAAYFKYKFDIKPIFFNYHHYKTILATTNSKQLGLDLAAAAIGALNIYKKSCVIVSIGTATTFSLIKLEQSHANNSNSSIGRFLGALIMPGMYSGFQGLISKVSKLPMPWFHKSIGEDELFYGANTTDAMQKGGYYGFLSMIEGAINRIINHFEEKPLIILTGGLANIFSKKDIPMVDMINSSLVINGLYYVVKHMDAIQEDQ